jgi:hypothetical protein
MPFKALAWYKKRVSRLPLLVGRCAARNAEPTMSRARAFATSVRRRSRSAAPIGIKHPTTCRPGVSFANFLLKNSSPSSAPVQASILCDYAMRLKPKRAGPLFTRISLSQALPAQLFLFRASSLLMLGVISGLRIFFCFSYRRVVAVRAALRLLVWSPRLLCFDQPSSALSGPFGIASRSRFESSESCPA